MNKKAFTLAELLIVVIIIVVLAIVAIPKFADANKRMKESSCRANLSLIKSAKKLWAQDNNKSIGDLPKQDDLVPKYFKWYDCPGGGQYQINPIGRDPVCSLAGHSLGSDR